MTSAPVFKRIIFVEKKGRFFAPVWAGRKRPTGREVTENTDANLVEAASRGDAESFSRLCELHYPALVAIAYAQLRDRDLAEDAAQEAFFAAFCDMSRLRKANHFAGWLVAICRNIAVDMAKARAREQKAGIENGYSVSNTWHHETDTVDVVRDVIFRLRPSLREVIFLRYYNQMTYGQIAATLGVSEQAVNGKLRRAKRRIRQELRRWSSLETGP